MKQNPGLSKEDEEIPAESEVPYDLGARRGSNYKTPMERSEQQNHSTITLDLQMHIVHCNIWAMESQSHCCTFSEEKKYFFYRCITARTARMKRRGSTFDNNDNDFNIVNSNNNVPSDDDSSFLTEKMQDNSWRRHQIQYLEQRPWFLNKIKAGVQRAAGVKNRFLSKK